MWLMYRKFYDEQLLFETYDPKIHISRDTLTELFFQEAKTPLLT